MTPRSWPRRNRTLGGLSGPSGVSLHPPWELRSVGGGVAEWTKCGGLETGAFDVSASDRTICTLRLRQCHRWDRCKPQRKPQVGGPVSFGSRRFLTANGDLLPAGVRFAGPREARFRMADMYLETRRRTLCTAPSAPRLTLRQAFGSQQGRGAREWSRREPASGLMAWMWTSCGSTSTP